MNGAVPLIEQNHRWPCCMRTRDAGAARKCDTGRHYRNHWLRVFKRQAPNSNDGKNGTADKETQHFFGQAPFGYRFRVSTQVLPSFPLRS